MKVDLSKFDAAYQDAPAEQSGKGEFTEVPDGGYQVRVARVELKESQAGNPMLEWELDIIGPKFAGRKMWRQNMIASEQNVKFLKQDLTLCGVTLRRMNDLNDESVLKKLIGVTLEVTRKTKGEYANVYFNNRISLGGGTANRRAPAPQQSNISDDDVPF